MISLYEAIENEKEFSEYCKRMFEEMSAEDKLANKLLKSEIQYHEQLAEWLEELKDLREMKETIECNAEVLERQGYNNAIDDTLEILKFHEDEWDGIYHAIDEIEHLKESYE